MTIDELSIHPVVSNGEAADAPADAYTEDNWWAGALCTQGDSESFFPGKGGSSDEARHTCMSCQVRVYCLEWALEHNERYGVWGGLSDQQRRELRRERRASNLHDPV
jgi:WhiB family redox-sensing transcriptional regulator